MNILKINFFVNETKIKIQQPGNFEFTYPDSELLLTGNEIPQNIFLIIVILNVSSDSEPEANLTLSP